jgi:HlyD family secretion protein
VRRADAVLGEAREQLGKTDIRSPMAGTVVALPIKVGETAIPSTSSLAGAQLVRIADTSAIQAELKVDEADIARIGVGQHADIYAAAFPDKAIAGEVVRISLAPTIEGMGRAYKVTLSLSVPKGMQLRSGMSVRADIHLGGGDLRLAAPVEAIASETGADGKTKRFVWRVTQGSARRAYVTTGISDDRLEEITGGLSNGDRIVVGPAESLRLLADGDPVRQRTGAERGPGDAKGEGKAGR